MVGAELKALGSYWYQALGQTTPLSKEAQLRLVMLSFGSTVLLSFAACLWSLQTGRLSQTLGLDWEVYLLLFCCAGASLLIQAVLAVAWLKAGDHFDATAFAMASFSSMAPFLSDQFDTLRDIIFGGLCLQSQHLFMKIVGVLSWSYLLAFHAWFFYVARYPSSVGHTIISSQTHYHYGMVWYSYGKKEYVDPNPQAQGANCFNELAASHLAVLLIAPKVQGELSGSCWEGTILPAIYSQVTKSKRHHLLIENVPQALMSVLFLAVEGGSFFVAAFNLVVPIVQIALAELLFEPVRTAAVPALGKRLNRAMKSGNAVAAKALWEEARSTGLSGNVHSNAAAWNVSWCSSLKFADAMQTEYMWARTGETSGMLSKVFAHDPTKGVTSTKAMYVNDFDSIWLIQQGHVLHRARPTQLLNTPRAIKATCSWLLHVHWMRFGPANTNQLLAATASSKLYAVCNEFHTTWCSIRQSKLQRAALCYTRALAPNLTCLSRSRSTSNGQQVWCQN